MIYLINATPGLIRMLKILALTLLLTFASGLHDFTSVFLTFDKVGILLESKNEKIG